MKEKAAQLERSQLTAGQERELAKEKEEANQAVDNISNPEALENALTRIVSVVQKSYLPFLNEKFTCVPINNTGEYNRYTFSISRWVCDPNEDTIEKLSNVYQVLQSEDCTFALEYTYGPDGLKTQLAIYSEKTNDGLREQLKGSFLGSFPGCIVSEENSNFWGDVCSNEDYNVGIVSVLPSEKSDHFRSQRLEKVFDAFQPKKEEESYRLILLAEPVHNLDDYKNTIFELYNAISPFAVVHKNISAIETHSLSASATRGLTVSGGVHVKLGDVFSINGNTAGNWSSTLGEGANVGTTQGQSVDYHNFSIKYYMESLEKQMKHLDQCTSTGAWRFTAYVVSKDVEMVHNVAKLYAALMRGDSSYIEPTVAQVWATTAENKCQKEQIPKILSWVSRGKHPNFESDEQTLPKTINPSVLMTGLELARAMNFPQKSVKGLTVTETAAFGRNITLLDVVKVPNDFEIGRIWHMRHDDGGKAMLDSSLLTSHAFITGSTGSGKSNAVYQLLDKLCKGDKHFLVVEPTKGEYKSVFGRRPDVTVYGTNYKQTTLLRINPFSFPEGIQLYAHLDRLIEIFNACWPMYAAMPAVLKDAIEGAYINAGWDLRTSENKRYGRLFPTFTDVLQQIDIVMNDSDYSADSKSDYKGALKTRLKSLTNGIFNDIFSCDEISEIDLFDRNAIVDLSEIGTETTSLIMGILVLKLQEYRMSDHKMNAKLKHITVLEEAHNLLKRTSTEQNAEGANLVGKSVEMIANAIAEMRTFGECFMIVDQSPSALDPTAIRNTNTKIILRLPDYSDRELVGKSVGLNDYQIIELGKLEQGVAAVYQSGWIESVLCKFDKYEAEGEYPNNHPEDQNMNQTAGILLNAVLYGSKVSEFANVIRRLKGSIVYRSTLPIALKRKVWEVCESSAIKENDLAGIAYELLEAETLFSNDKKPGKSEVAQQFRRMLRRYQISDQAMKEANLVILLELLNQEHSRREKNYVYGALMGGVK